MTDKKLSRCWDSATCEPLDAAAFSTPHITRYYDPSRLRHAGILVVPISTFCCTTSSQSTNITDKTDGQTSRRHGRGMEQKGDIIALKHVNICANRFISHFRCPLYKQSSSCFSPSHIGLMWPTPREDHQRHNSGNSSDVEFIIDIVSSHSVHNSP